MRRLVLGLVLLGILQVCHSLPLKVNLLNASPCVKALVNRFLENIPAERPYEFKTDVTDFLLKGKTSLLCTPERKSCIKILGRDGLQNKTTYQTNCAKLKIKHELKKVVGFTHFNPISDIIAEKITWVLWKYVGAIKSHTTVVTINLGRRSLQLFSFLTTNYKGNSYSISKLFSKKTLDPENEYLLVIRSSYFNKKVIMKVSFKKILNKHLHQVSDQNFYGGYFKDVSEPFLLQSVGLNTTANVEHDIKQQKCLALIQDEFKQMRLIQAAINENINRNINESTLDLNSELKKCRNESEPIQEEEDTYFPRRWKLLFAPHLPLLAWDVGIEHARRILGDKFPTSAEDNLDYQRYVRIPDFKADKKN